jgi:hypothetical protein
VKMKMKENSDKKTEKSNTKHKAEKQLESRIKKQEVLVSLHPNTQLCFTTYRCLYIPLFHINRPHGLPGQHYSDVIPWSFKSCGIDHSLDATLTSRLLSKP